jgi:hypothetical protein
MRDPTKEKPTSHTAVITQTDALHSLIEPFLKGETPKSFFE